MRQTLAACLAALALTGLAACADESATVAETGTTSTTEATTTSEAVGGNTDSTGEGGATTETTTPDASSTTLPSGTSSSTTEPEGVADTAEDAANGLFGAWQSGDESAAPGFAEQAAVDAVFAEDPAGFAGAEGDGCTADDAASSAECSWTGDGQVLTMRVEGSDEEGWRVVAVTFAAD